MSGVFRRCASAADVARLGKECETDDAEEGRGGLEAGCRPILLPPSVPSSSGRSGENMNQLVIETQSAYLPKRVRGVDDNIL